MPTIRWGTACTALLISACAYGQSNPVERRAVDFVSNGVCLTETLLAFSHREHIPIAVEYVDRASMEQPIDVKLENTTIRGALNSILNQGNGYRWRMRNGIIEITNLRGSKHAETLLNTVIPIFEIHEGATVKWLSVMLWWNLQVELDPSLKKGGFLGDILGSSSAVKPETLRNRTVEDILAYIVVHSQAEGWVAAGPSKCLGYTPYCGLWYFIEGDAFSASYQSVLRQVQQNL